MQALNTFPPMVSGGTALATESTLSLMIPTYSVFPSSKTLQQAGISLVLSHLLILPYIVLHSFSAINTTVFYYADFTKPFSIKIFSTDFILIDIYLNLVSKKEGRKGKQLPFVNNTGLDKIFFL